jgi:hypothetical protein
MRPPHARHWKELSSSGAVVAHAGWMQRWKAASVIRSL